MKKLILTAMMSLVVLTGSAFAAQNRDRDRGHDQRVKQGGEHRRMRRHHRRHYRRHYRVPVRHTDISHE